MAAQALPLAKLLAGEMPRDIEDVLDACKLTLFPASYHELRATCSCPDAANPCKHIAAVYYILAERFDHDPFVMFAWRGRTQDELLERLRARRARATGKRVSSDAASTDAPAPVEPPPKPSWRGPGGACSPSGITWTSVIRISSSCFVAPTCSSPAPPSGARWRSESKGTRHAA